MKAHGKRILNHRKSTVGWAMGLILFILLLPSVVKSDEAQYFYDKLGRLVGVVDGQGDVAVYNYDAVGNLLSIERFASSGTDIGILALSPSKGEVGIDVEIQGYGFSPTPADSQVKFNGTTATVSSSTPNVIVATVPTGATTGPVTVTNAIGTATSPEPFNVITAPTISGIDPGRFAQGTVNIPVIEGENLSDAQAVTFSQAGLSAEILSGATSENLPIRLVVASNVPTGSYPFTVVTPGGEAQSGEITVTISPPTPAFDNAILSVFMPITPEVPENLAPSGSSEKVASPTSVSMPIDTSAPAAVAPEGSSIDVAPPTSVEMPIDTSVSATVAPEGSSIDVVPPTSVDMPISADVPSTSAPSGSSMSVAPPESVLMPE